MTSRTSLMVFLFQISKAIKYFFLSSGPSTLGKFALALVLNLEITCVVGHVWHASCLNVQTSEIAAINVAYCQFYNHCQTFLLFMKDVVPNNFMPEGQAILIK